MDNTKKHNLFKKKGNSIIHILVLALVFYDITLSTHPRQQVLSQEQPMAANKNIMLAIIIVELLLVMHKDNSQNGDRITVFLSWSFYLNNNYHRDNHN